MHEVATTRSGARSLRAEPGGNRLVPYLKDGTAGLLIAGAMLGCASPGSASVPPELLVSLASDLATPFTLEPSLAEGAAGLGVGLELLRNLLPREAAELPDPNWGRLDKYLLSLGDGVGTLGAATLRFDLSYHGGSAGILEALRWREGLGPLNFGGLHLPTPSQALSLATDGSDRGWAEIGIAG